VKTGKVKIQKKRKKGKNQYRKTKVLGHSKKPATALMAKRNAGDLSEPAPRMSVQLAPELALEFDLRLSPGMRKALRERAEAGNVGAREMERIIAAIGAGGDEEKDAKSQALNARGGGQATAQSPDPEGSGREQRTADGSGGADVARQSNGEEKGEKQIRRRATGSREELLNAAMNLFWEKGYAETSMTDVFTRSGVNAGSMYYYFKSKEELLLAVLDKLAEIMYSALMAPIWETEKDPIGRIFGLLERYRRAILDSKFSYGCPVGRLAVEIPAEMVEAHAKIAMNFEGWSGAVRKCLEDAGSRLPKGMDLRQLSRFVLTVMEGGVMQSRSYKSIEPFEQAVAQLRDYFDRLEDQGEAEAIKAGKSYWDLPKRKKRGTFPR
jgi:TetR/AcrR family transcriptional regulator, transcriptional repressor for nem operon